jgi:hypothetical protein
MLKVIFITTQGSTGVDTHVTDFPTLKSAEAALKEFNRMTHPGMTFLAKRLYDLEEEKANPVYIMGRPDLGGSHA